MSKKGILFHHFVMKLSQIFKSFILGLFISLVFQYAANINRSTTMIPFIIMIRNKDVEKGHGVWVVLLLLFTILIQF